MQAKILQVLMGTVGAFGFSILFNVRGMKLIPATLGGFISWGTCLLFQPLIPEEAIRYVIATTVLTFYSEYMARKYKCPATVFLTAGSIPLIPGGSLYFTINFAMTKQWDLFFHKAVATLLLMIAMSAGILISMTVIHIIHQLSIKKITD